MERLTEKIEEHYIARQDRVNGKIIGNQQCLDKLGYLENLAEQGRLIELPCKMGDALYFIENGEVFEFVVYSFDIRPLQRFVRDHDGMSLNFSKFNKIKFLTKSEAEAKLKELESESE